MIRIETNLRGHGKAIGRAYMPNQSKDAVKERKGAFATLKGEKAIDKFKTIFKTVQSNLESLAVDNPIFAAHLEILEDPIIQDTVIQKLTDSDLSLAESLEITEKEIIRMFDDIEDEYLNARTADIRDIFQGMYREMGVDDQSNFADLHANSIIIADELLPSDMASIDLTKIEAILTVKGSSTSHVAIMARNNDIPALIGLGSVLQNINSNSTLIVDADKGIVIADPDKNTYERYKLQIAADNDMVRKFRKNCEDRICREDGRQIYVCANVGSVEEISRAMENGADGIGLFRTELLFLNYTHSPSEEEQYLLYRDAVQKCKDKSLTFRTIDIGGDKPSPFLAIPEEENPFMGWRGIRICLEERDLFKTQVRAILRASAFGKTRIMFPMITSADELSEAKSIIYEAENELNSEGYEYDTDILIGTMIETPAAVLMADELAKEADFFSIGTNDLTQYIMAADRGNPKVSKLNDPLSAPVTKAISMIVSAAKKHNIQVGVCGELAAEESGVKILYDLGIDEFSVAVPCVGETKSRLRTIQLE